MHGLRRPSYDLLKVSPEPNYKRHSMQTVRELSTSNLKEYLNQHSSFPGRDYSMSSGSSPSRNFNRPGDNRSNYSPTKNPRGSKKNSLVNYIASRLSVIPMDADLDEYARYYYGVKKCDWAIYFGILLAVVVFILALVMLYVISTNHKIRFNQHHGGSRL